MKWTRSTLLFALVAAVVAVVAAAAWSRRAPPHPAEAHPSSAPGERGAPSERGAVLYRTGVNARGEEIRATLGANGIVISARDVPCAGCHGEDGRGRPEGAARPPDIRWASLTRPYAVSDAVGRRRPPYDDKLFVRAVTMGIDPGNNRLSDVMPRYQLSLLDVAELDAYLHVLGPQREPGIGDAILHVAAILPVGEDDVRAAIQAQFDTEGAVYGRHVELSTVELPAGGGKAREDAARAFLERERPFAVTSAFLDGPSDPVIALLDDQGVPVIAVSPSVPEAKRRRVFYLHAGVVEQAEALAVFATERGARGAGVVVVRSGDPADDALARRVGEACVRRGLGEVVEARVPGDEAARRPSVAALAKGGAHVLLLLGPAGVERSIWDEVERGRWRPTVLVPGALAGEGLFVAPASLAGRVHVAFASVPDDARPGALAEYRATAAARGVPGQHLGAQLSAVVGARLLIEALKRAGRDVSRELLVAGLEAMRHVDTGLTPPITYGPGRHVGTLGAHVVTMEPGGRRSGRWIGLE